ncbi:hypothetical protein JH06_4981 [Blastocystis sp. subtype 4]|uniref:hypothetical protein n=1 Tax=Blastocystis sp. subtype 4 TaxID=944170 RepID=UPI000711A6E7|nr:hypothetical protein JH06_4981 [Blastocystis sp. subtype 4]KNB43698.1 hypothetical protein JH06_4981 [Blastocystis sp. subtype 4]|eukprot:XP_014527141.1 hypothetical protein JH06_4981 [Blastocystis sp. subtype 4]
MTRDQSETVLKDEIVKCWDDGEVANYDRLVLLCEKTNVNIASEHGWTPLMVVMGNPLGDVKVVNKLLKLGADPMMKDEDGWNCLHWAAYHSNVGAVEVMMENGASSAVMNLLIEKNKDNLTPLELAEKEGQSGFVAWLRTAVLDELEVMKDLGNSIDQGTEKQLIPLLEDKQ